MKTIIALYYSKKGNVLQITKRFQGIFHELFAKDVKLELMDAVQMDKNKLLEAAGYIIGSPDYYNYPSGYIKLFFDELYDHRSNLNGRPVITFFSSMSGNKHFPLDMLCGHINLKVIEPSFAFKGRDVTIKDEKKIQKALQKMLESI